ncbi:MAG: hypothetical protein ACE5LU_27860, partial [Anaerolineae bacterium]
MSSNRPGGAALLPRNLALNQTASWAHSCLHGPTTRPRDQWNILKNAQDDGSVITWDLGTVKAGSEKKQTFLARLRPGANFPADPTTLLNATITPNDLTLTIDYKLTLDPNEGNCGSFTPGDVIQFIFEYRNDGSADVDAGLVVDYDESLINTYGPGGLILGGGSAFAGYTVLGQFFVPEGSRGKKHDEPLDMNYNGVIDTDDLAKFVVEFDDWDPTTGEFTVSTDLTRLDPLEVIRNFRDANGNGKPDGSEEVSLYLQREPVVDRVINAIPLAYMNDYNKTAPTKAEFSGWWLWRGIDPFGFKGIEGQGPRPGFRHWAKLKSNTAIL